MFSAMCPSSFVCVQDYSKTRAWIWMKCCVSTDVGTWTNWLTFEPNPDHSSDAGTGFLSPIAYVLQRSNVEFYYIGKIHARTDIGGPSKQQLQRMVLRHWKTVVGGKCAFPSALLVIIIIISLDDTIPAQSLMSLGKAANQNCSQT